MLVDPPIQRTATDDPLTSSVGLEDLKSPFDSNGSVDLLLSDIEVPLRPVEVPGASAAERAAHRASVESVGNGGGRPVLVVESTAIARKFLARRLESLGYEVHVAETAAGAMQMIKQQSFTIAFVELSLGSKAETDGLRVCQAIKMKSKAGRAMPAVVMITGKTDSTNRVRSSLAGCDAYLTKPLIEADFVTALVEVDPLFK